MLPIASHLDARKNHLLSALSREDYRRVGDSLELRSFKLGSVIYETGERLRHLYFPTTAIVALIYTLENGSTAEVGMVGNEGMFGIPILTGGCVALGRAVLQSEGLMLRMSARAAKAEFSLGGGFQDLALRYVEALILQISQTAVCNRLHEIEPQLCRWILQTHDRLMTDEIATTHDLIAHMLGVRREGITLATHKLALKGLIAIKRGSITVLDRVGLEEAACECYRAVTNEHNRLLGRGVARTFPNATQ